MNTDERFYQILCDVSGCKREKLHESQSLPDDLGITGMDGWEIVERLEDKLGIDFSGFDSDKYFGPEVGFNPFIYIYEVLTGKSKYSDECFKKLTIRHMCRVCERGKWFEPD